MELANRAGKPTGATATPGAEWNAQVQQNLHYPRFNLLQLDQNPDNPAGRNVERWRDNRIGWSQEAESQGATHYRYDSWGNRTQALHSDGSTTELHYDSLHQLRQVVQIDAQGKAQSTTTYRYDAFGRRVSKTHDKTGQQSRTTHYGWDGDRLVHTETAEHIHHTVYEPGSFVPLLQVQRNKDKEGQTDPVKTLLNLGNNEASSPLEQELPREERELLHQALKEALQPGYQLSALVPQEMRGQVQESIKALKDAQAQTEAAHPLTIRHMLTDHLGTPIALVNANGNHAGQVVWAARYGAWGEIEEEYNPSQIHQPIRFQGQQLDQETGLHYNRFRYYDPRVGQYVTQDPIGWLGSRNFYSYATRPVTQIDPLGLQGTEPIQSRIDEISAQGTGVRVGGAKATVGKVDVKVGGKSVASEKGAEISVGEPCKGNEESLSPLKRVSKLFEKTVGTKSVGVSATGVSASVDPVCIDPGQVVKRTAATATQPVVDSDVAKTLAGRKAALEKMEGATSTPPTPSPTCQAVFSYGSAKELRECAAK